MKKDAVISDCGRYRYRLSRVWNDDLPKCLFIMLNPSTADAEEDDPTIRRCIAFAKSWGYGSLYVGNMYGLRSTDPMELIKQDNVVGKDNLTHLLELNDLCDITVLAFGSTPAPCVNINYHQLLGNFKKLHYLKINRDGKPAHPLYLKRNLTPLPYPSNQTFA